MKEINLISWLIDSLSHYLQGFIHPRWLFGSSPPPPPLSTKFHSWKFQALAVGLECAKSTWQLSSSCKLVGNLNETKKKPPKKQGENCWSNLWGPKGGASRDFLSYFPFKKNEECFDSEPFRILKITGVVCKIPFLFWWGWDQLGCSGGWMPGVSKFDL